MKTKKIALFLAGVIAGLLAVVLGYVLYMVIQFYRIEDNLSISTENNQTEIASASDEFSVLTFNIGFGAYTHDFSFFMDSGVMKTGEAVSGKNSTAASKEVVLKNTNGAIELAKKQDADFYFFQEVDVKATRSHKVNQLAAIQEAFGQHGSAFSYNFHSAFLAYPFHDPHGSVDAGIATLSRYAIASTTRHSFPVDLSFPTKFFDLDRCFQVSRLALDNGKELVLVNLHMSAYDEGGIVRQQQLKLLNDVLAEEVKKGNYVVAGGDFNHDIAGSLNAFETAQEVPEWVFVLTDEDLAEGLRFAAAKNVPTCRSTDIPYEKGVNYTVVLDGFIVSDNVEVLSVTNVDADFEFSDHNPALLRFALLP